MPSPPKVVDSFGIVPPAVVNSFVGAEADDIGVSGVTAVPRRKNLRRGRSFAEASHNGDGTRPKGVPLYRSSGSLNRHKMAALLDEHAEHAKADGAEINGDDRSPVNLQEIVTPEDGDPREKMALLNMNAAAPAGSPVASPPSQPPRRLMASRFLSEPGDAPVELADIDGPQKLSLSQHTTILSRTNLKVETNFRSDCL